MIIDTSIIRRYQRIKEGYIHTPTVRITRKIMVRPPVNVQDTSTATVLITRKIKARAPVISTPIFSVTTGMRVQNAELYIFIYGCYGGKISTRLCSQRHHFRCVCPPSYTACYCSVGESLVVSEFCPQHPWWGVLSCVFILVR